MSSHNYCFRVGYELLKMSHSLGERNVTGICTKKVFILSMFTLQFFSPKSMVACDWHVNFRMRAKQNQMPSFLETYVIFLFYRKVANRNLTGKKRFNFNITGIVCMMQCTFSLLLHWYLQEKKENWVWNYLLQELQLSNSHWRSPSFTCSDRKVG